MLSNTSVRYLFWVRVGAILIVLCLANGAVQAETLREALTAAYLFNPTLKAARAQLRSTDNQVSIAKSGYRPNVSANLQYGFEDIRTRFKKPPPGFIAVCAVPTAFDGTCPDGQSKPAPLSSIGSGILPSGTSNPRIAQVNLQQNVFDGFQTYNNIKGAEAQVEASRESLRSSEENVLLNAATAYMNVVRDQAIVKLRESNIRVLAEQFNQTEARFAVGEATRTDVAQSRASLAQAQADLSIAQGTLYTDRALFQQFIGHPAGSLKDPGPPTRLLPKSLEGAIEVTFAENPGILSAIFSERAQMHQVKQLKGQLMPNLSLNASYTKAAQPLGNPEVKDQDDLRVYGQLNIPIYEAGSVSGQIRQGIETLSQRRQQIDEQRESARQNVSSQWGLIIAAKGNVAAGQAAVQATRIVLEGIRQEQKVGQRTILDVLNAAQQYLNAQVNLVSFRRDLVVASYGVLAAMGRLTAYDIALEAELYDPTRYYGEVKDLFYGWGASIESAEDPHVAPVRDPGRLPGQNSTDGPAYMQKLPQLP